jgi:hypothetical protein
MWSPDNVFFWPAIVLIGMIIIIISARLLFRFALFVLSLLIIWYALYFVGLAPSPTQFFKQYEVKKLETIGLL